jgi:phospholipase/lecithinase/hemolysin
LDSLNLSTLDTYSLLDGIVANPSMYGFTNVTSPSVTGAIDYVGGTAGASLNAIP